MNDYSQSIIDKLKELEPILRKDFGIKRLRVFGSVARGDAKPGSDVDLIADFSKMPGWGYFSMDADVSKLIGIPVDLGTENSLHKRLKDQILSEAKDVYH